jgi:hypothetical protein
MLPGVHPNSIVVGSSLSFTTQVIDYPASDGWVLSMRLVPRGSGSAILLTGAPDADDPSLHRIAVAAATTAGWTAGAYSWASWVMLATEVYDIEHGSITLLPDPRVATAPLDLRTDAEIALAAAKAAFATQAGSTTTRSYTIHGRSMTFTTAAEILPVIRYWEIEVQREQRAERQRVGLSDPRKAFVRLGRG